MIQSVKNMIHKKYCSLKYIVYICIEISYLEFSDKNKVRLLRFVNKKSLPARLHPNSRKKNINLKLQKGATKVRNDFDFPMVLDKVGNVDVSERDNTDWLRERKKRSVENLFKNRVDEKKTKQK